MAQNDAPPTPEGAQPNPVFMAIAELQDEAPSPEIAETQVKTPTSPTPVAHPPSPPVDEPPSTATIGLSHRPAARKASQAPRSSVSIPAEGAPGAKALLVPAGVGLLAGFIGALVFSMAAARLGTPRSPSSPVKEAVPPSAKPAGPEELKALTTQIDQLAARVDQFSVHLEGKANTSALGALEVRVDDLARPSNEVGTLPGRFKGIDDHLATLDQMVGRLRAELTAPRVKGGDRPVAETLKPTAPSPPPAAVPASASDEENPELRRGIELFHRGKYKDALGVFNRLELTLPDDARVWYFAALSHGFATNEWGGGTIPLFERGVEREIAGTPGTGVLDATFRDLNPANGKEVLATYRRRVRAR